MIQVQYPEPHFSTKTTGGKRYIFDNIRKSWILLTSEEWVRQNFISFLVEQLKYPASCIALEKQINLNGLQKRFDILVYDSGHKPWMMVECKAPEVPLTESVLQQVLRYNMTVPVTFIVTTNGRYTIAWKKEGEGMHLISDWPSR